MTSITITPSNYYPAPAVSQSATSELKKAKNKVVKVWPLLSNAGHAFWGLKGSMVELLDRLRSGMSSSYYVSPDSLLGRTIRYGALAAPVAVPFYLFSMYQGTKTMFSEGATHAEKKAAGMNVVSNLGFTCMNVGGFLDKMASLQWVSSSVSAFAKPLTGIGCILTIAESAYYLREYREKSLLEEDLGKNFDTFFARLDPLKTASKKTHETLKKHFVVDDKAARVIYTLFEKSVKKVIEDPISEIQAKDENADFRSQLQATLKGRASRLKKNSYLSLLSAAVMFVATAIFLFSPLAPLGFVLFTAAAMIGIYKFYHETKSNKLFAENLSDLIKSTNL